MATKKFVMEIPLILHDMVQEFVVTALSARPSNYVDFAVEYYLHLQTKDDRSTYENSRMDSLSRSPGGWDAEAVSHTANIFQVSINPVAFDNPDKHFHSEDDYYISPDNPCDDPANPAKTDSFANVAFLNQQFYPLMKSDPTSLPISTTHSPPIAISFQDTSFSVTSSTNTTGLLPITSPIAAMPAAGHPINLHLQSPISISAASSSRPLTPNNSPLVSTTLNSAVKLHVVAEANSPHQPFTTPLKNGFTNPFTNELNSHQRYDKTNPSHFQCKSCRGVFKPNRPNHPYLSLPSSPEIQGPPLPLPSTQEQPQLFSLYPTSHIQSADTFCPNSSPPSYYATTTSHTPNKTAPDLLERKFHCPICEKSYKSNTGLKRHLIVHSGERPFQCHYCFKSFFRKYVLTTHISRVHNKVIAATQS